MQAQPLVTSTCKVLRHSGLAWERRSACWIGLKGAVCHPLRAGQQWMLDGRGGKQSGRYTLPKICPLAAAGGRCILAPACGDVPLWCSARPIIRPLKTSEAH